MSTTAEQALYTVLNAHAGLAALIGTGAAMRCYPVEAPQGTALPLLVFQVLTTNPATTHGEGTESRLDGLLAQLTALAATPLQAAAVIYQARLALETSTTLKGVMTDEGSLPRSEEADCYGKRADFNLWNYPDA